MFRIYTSHQLLESHTPSVHLSTNIEPQARTSLSRSSSSAFDVQQIHHQVCFSQKLNIEYQNIYGCFQGSCPLKIMKTEVQSYGSSGSNP